MNRFTEKIRPQNNRFYLNRRLVTILVLFIVAASGLVVLINFSINMIAASRGLTAFSTRWNLEYYKATIAIERFGTSGKQTYYLEYLQAQKGQNRLYLPIQELMSEHPNAKKIFKSFGLYKFNPNEISALILTMKLNKALNVNQEIQRDLQGLYRIKEQQDDLAEKIDMEFASTPPESRQVKKQLSQVDRLNHLWNIQNNALLGDVGSISLEMRRLGLWLSVVIGILLVLIGIIISVRTNKSIGRWQQALNEKEVLLAEIHHRVKNNLAVISGLLELESFQDRDPKMALKQSRDRIKSMAMIHEILYQSNSFSEMDLDTYIRDLAEYICYTYSGNDQKISLSTELEKVSVNLNQAVPAGLILNELLANTIEHSFESDQPLEIVIHLFESGGEIYLTVRDNGTGFPEDFDYERPESTGIAIIKALADQLKAELVFHNDKGLITELQFKKSVE